MNDKPQQLPFVALLVAVVLLFGAIWSQDSGMSRSGEIANSSLLAGIVNRTAVDEADWDPTDSQPVSIDFDWNDCGIPLPDNLAPGSYRIVNSRGRTTTEYFTAELISEIGIELDPTPRNLYEFEEDGVHWYYIRLDDSDGEAAEKEISSARTKKPLIAPRPSLKAAIRRKVLSSLTLIRTSISSRYRRAAEGVLGAVDHVVHSPSRMVEKLTQAFPMPEPEDFSKTIPWNRSGIDTESLLDSIDF